MDNDEKNNYEERLLDMLTNRINRLRRQNMVPGPDGDRVTDDLIDETSLEGDICWAVAENVEAILQKGQKTETNNIDAVISALKNNSVVKVFQDRLSKKGKQLGQDHWFAMVGTNEGVYIIEYLPNICNHHPASKLPVKRIPNRKHPAKT